MNHPATQCRELAASQRVGHMSRQWKSLKRMERQVIPGSKFQKPFDNARRNKASQELDCDYTILHSQLTK